MKALKNYLKNNSIMFLLALIIGLIGRMSVGYFSDAVKTYAESIIINYSRNIIDQGVTNGVIDDLNGESLLQEVYDSNGKVSYAYLDARKINMIRTNTSKYVTEAIDVINNQDTFKSIEIPLGYFFGRNYFLSNGIKVPIELEVIGNQSIEIKSSVESYGINTTILKVELHVSLDIQSVIPFQSAKIKTNTIIPLSLEIINNEIPYYLGDLLEWIFLFIFLK